MVCKLKPYGVSKVIAKAAGTKHVKECEDLVRRNGPVPETSCKVTSSGALVPYVIHVVGITAKSCKNDEDRKRKMGIVFTNVFKTAKSYKIAIPAVGTGTMIYGKNITQILVFAIFVVVYL